MTRSSLTRRLGSLLALADAYAFECRVLPDGTCRLVSVAGAFEQLTGRSAGDGALANLWDELPHPGDSPAVRSFEQQLRNNQAARCALRIVTPDARHVSVQMAAQPIWSTGARRVTGFYGIVSSRPDLARTGVPVSDEAREDLNRAQALVQAGSWRMDMQRNQLVWSDETWRIFGLPAGTPLTYETFLATVHPDDRAYVNERWFAALCGDTYDIEHRIIANGEVKWVRERAVLEFDNGGTLTGGFGVCQDITLRKRAEEASRANEERFRGLVEQAVDGIFVADAKGRYLDVNTAGAQMLGYTREEIIGRTIADVVAEEEVARIVPEVDRFAGGQVVRSEWRFRRKDGSFFTGEVVGRQLPEGRLQAIVRDITERKRTEEALQLSEQRLRAANEQLVEADRRKDEFLSILSHELRTPLNAVMGWSHMLLRGGLDQRKAHRAIEAIARSARAQSQIVEDILDVSRIITGKVRIARDPVDLAQVVRQAIESVRPAADAKAIDIHLDLEPVVVVTGDAARLRQVCWNLLANAVKFTPEHGRVSVRLERRDPGAHLAVTDSGVGISPAFLPRVFDRFAQADSTTTRQYAGLGLGLAIVRHIVELHGGSVSAASAGEGSGATFVVDLPERDRREEEAAADPGLPRATSRPVVTPSPGAGPPDGILRGLHVLVVDDEAETRLMVQAVLESFGATAVAAGSVAEATRALAAAAFDVIVTDIAMPDEDGYRLVRHVRATSRIPAIALTAHGRAEDRDRALEAGFLEHLKKPALPEEIALAVARAAGRTSANRAV